MADRLGDIDDATLARRFKNADGLARGGNAKAKADAKIMAQEINRRRAGGASPTPDDAPSRFGASSGQNVPEQLASGLTEGLLKGTVGTIVDGAQGVLNLPQRVYDIATMQDYDPYFKNGIGSSNWIGEKLENTRIPDIPLPFTDDVLAGGTLVAPQPEEGNTFGRYARRTGQITGGGIGALAMGSGLSQLPLALGRVGTTIANGMNNLAVNHTGKALLGEILAGTAATGGGIVGGEVGEDVATNMGVNPDMGRGTGEFLGELLGGVTPAAAMSAAGGVGRYSLAARDSAERYNAAIRAGVRPTPGLIGNQNAAYIENTAGLNPLGGAFIKDRQQAQVGAATDFRDRITDELRGGAQPADTPYSAGVQIRTAGQDALARLETRIGQLTDQEMAALGGEEGAIRIDALRREIKKARPSLDQDGQLDLDARLRGLEAIRTTPIDPALDTQLKTRLGVQRTAQATREATLKAIEAKVQAGTATPQERRQAQNLRMRMPGYQRAIDTTKGQIDNNLGVRNDQLDYWRRRLGEETKTSGKVAKKIQDKLYAGVRNDQRITALGQGALDEFTDAVSTKRRLVGKATLEEGADVPFMRKLVEDSQGRPRDPESVYDFLTKPYAAGRIKRYRANVSKEEFKTTIGNMIDMMGRPTTEQGRSGGTNSNTFSPKTFMTRWQNLPKETQAEMFSAADIEQRTNDLKTIAKSLAARGTAANPSGTAAIAIMAKIFGQGMRNAPLTVLTLWGNTALSHLFMSEPFTRAIAGVNPTFAQDMLTLFPGRANAANQTETSR